MILDSVELSKPVTRTSSGIFLSLIHISTDDFIIVYLSNDVSDFELELTWLKDHPQPYNLGECEFHLAFKAEDYEACLLYTSMSYLLIS